MSVKYSCKRCDCYNTILIKDLYKHLSKKHKCTRNKKSYELSDDQLLVLSLYTDDGNDASTLTKEDIKFLENSDIMYNNVNELISDLEKAFKNKSRKCLLCNQQFAKMNDLRHHIIMDCFIDKIKNKNNEKSTKDIVINGNNNNSTIYNADIINNNIDNSTSNIVINDNSINNITNNNIYLNSKYIVPFDDKWDTSMFDKKTKYFLVFNQLMYSSFLEEILKNDNNLNVIIDKQSNSGIVYKNKEEDYVTMKLKDIVSETMEKIKTQLLEINKELKPEVFEDVNTYQRRMITKKHIDYVKDKKLQNNVNACIVEIFNNKKIDAINVSKNK